MFFPRSFDGLGCTEKLEGVLCWIYAQIELAPKQSRNGSAALRLEGVVNPSALALVHGEGRSGTAARHGLLRPEGPVRALAARSPERAG